jgi:hypothetical protein
MTLSANVCGHVLDDVWTGWFQDTLEARAWLAGSDTSAPCDRAVLPHEVPSPVSRGAAGLGLVEERAVQSQRTIRSNAMAKNTLWALCTAIPIQALR